MTDASCAVTKVSLCPTLCRNKGLTLCYLILRSAALLAHIVLVILHTV